MTFGRYGWTAFAAVLTACSAPVDVGGACASDEDCKSGLVCDDHGGDKTCQIPHEHPGSTTSGGGGGAGGQGGAGGGPSSACVQYCACLQPTCASVDGYPHGSVGACEAACEAMSEDERTCWFAYCVQAGEATVGKDHLCEHAWGANGLDEC